jgi:arylsulfatase A-like enzyme
MRSMIHLLLILACWPSLLLAQENAPAASSATNPSSASSSAGSRPNIVFVLADDLGYQDLGSYGHSLHETPHIDSLARGGVRFTQAYANAPNCAPSRASLMSGRLSPAHGIYTVGSSARGKKANRQLVPPPNTRILAEDFVTLAERLQTAGYATGHFGKWHLGQDPRTQGFDVNVGGNLLGHPKSYFSPYRNPQLEDGPEGEYLTDRLTNEALSFIEQHKNGRFFVYLSHFAVHTPIQARKDLLERHDEDTPKRVARYAAMVDSLDQSVGRILTRLDELKLSKNTLFVFFSDNGGHGAWTSHAPLRGSKGMLYEGGIRVPLILRWPAQLAAGQTNDNPVQGTDLYPTLCAAAGIELPEDARLAGLDLLPHLMGNRELPKRPLYWHFPAYLEGYRKGELWRTTPASALRLGRYKLIEFFEGPRLELYDLVRDPSEAENLVGARPLLAERLYRRLRSWRKQSKAALPRPK